MFTEVYFVNLHVAGDFRDTSSEILEQLCCMPFLEHPFRVLLLGW